MEELDTPTNERTESVRVTNFPMQLLFKTAPARPNTSEVLQALEQEFENVSVTMEEDELSVFELENFLVPETEGKLRAKIVVTRIYPFELEKQEDRSKLVDYCDHKLLDELSNVVLVSDLLTSTFEFEDRSEIIIGAISAMMNLFDHLTAIWFPKANTFLEKEEIECLSSEDLIKRLTV